MVKFTQQAEQDVKGCREDFCEWHIKNYNSICDKCQRTIKAKKEMCRKFLEFLQGENVIPIHEGFKMIADLQGAIKIYEVVEK